MFQDGRITRRPTSSGGCKAASEAILLAMAVLSPWAFGAVDAWAELWLYSGAVALAALMVPACWSSGSWPGLSNTPARALAALTLFAWVQSIALPEQWTRTLTPTLSSIRSELAPATASRVIVEGSAPVEPPAPTLAWDAEEARGAAAKLAATWIIFQAALMLGKGSAPLRRFAFATALNATILALFGMIQALTWDGAIYGIRRIAQVNGWLTGGPFVSHNHLAASLNLGLGFALAGALAGGPRQGARPSRTRLPLLAAYASGVLIAGMIASHSRGGFLAMSASLATIGVLVSLVQRREPVAVPGRRLEARRWAIGTVAVFLMAALTLVAVGSGSPFERLATIADPEARGYGLRFEIWGASSACWRSSPFWGTGLGSFPAAVAPYFRRDRGIFASHAENELLELLTEGGLFGLTLAILALVGLGKLSWSALRLAPDRSDRAIISSAIFGILAVLLASLGDFPLHIPAIGVAVAISAAHLCRLGVNPERAPARTKGRVLATVEGLATTALAVVLLWHGDRMAKVEAIVMSAGLPLPGAYMPTVEPDGRDRGDLDRRRTALVHALRLCPDWAEGHLRLGQTLIGLYQDTAEDWVEESGSVGSSRGMVPLSDPLWLHRVVHAAGAGQIPRETLLAHEPIREYLVPAARCFLEARRCSPALALPHARLAGLDYLIRQGEPAPTHASRALRQGVADFRVLVLAARAACHSGDLDLAATIWRRALLSKRDEWAAVADAVDADYPPGLILDRILPPGALPRLRFSDRLYISAGEGPTRELFLRSALESLPGDPEIDASERPWVEGQIRARLGEREKAMRLMAGAIEARPRCIEWRQELIAWLVEDGDLEAAHRHALIGTQLVPEHAGLNKALREVVESMARGGPIRERATIPIEDRPR